MSVQVSYKKQFIVIFLLLMTFLITIEILVNIWLYFFYECDFEKSEIFKEANPELNRKVCLDSISYGFTSQRLIETYGTGIGRGFGGVDENVVNINSEGLRGAEFSKNKTENTYRIFVLGGSTTFGAGVLDNQTFPYYLEKSFDDSNLDFKVEVINAGWPGRWSLQEAAMVKEQLLEFEPNLFIVYDGINDSIEVKRNHPEASATLWKERWEGICKLGKSYGYDTIITLQPQVGTGKKILTEQEYQ